MSRGIHVAIILGACLSAGIADEKQGRIVFDAQINGQPVQLAFDTGAEGPILFRRTARRLGLQVTEPPSNIQPTPGKVRAGMSEKCLLEIGPTTARLTFAVVDLPGFLQPGIDGVMGWGALNDNVIQIGFTPNKIQLRDTLGIDPSQWSCYELRPDSNVLVLQLPRGDGGKAQVLIDSGSPAGVCLSHERWQRWVQPDRRATLSAAYYAGRGLLVIEEVWAREVTLEGLTFTEVPVNNGIEAGLGAVPGDLDAILGMCAMSCFSWVFDGPAGKIYVKPNDVTRVPEKYDYNRLGATFTPDDIQTTNDLIAHVAQPSPAYEAGIRNGDILMKIGSLDVTKWRTDPNVLPLSRFWEQPAGCELNLELQRNGQTIDLAVTLQEIFATRQDRL